VVGAGAGREGCLVLLRESGGVGRAYRRQVAGFFKRRECGCQREIPVLVVGSL